MKVVLVIIEHDYDFNRSAINSYKLVDIDIDYLQIGCYGFNWWYGIGVKAWL